SADMSLSPHFMSLSFVMARWIALLCDMRQYPFRVLADIIASSWLIPYPRSILYFVRGVFHRFHINCLNRCFSHCCVLVMIDRKCTRLNSSHFLISYTF